MMRIRLPVLVLLALGLGFCAAYAVEDYVPPEPLQEMGLTKFWQLQLPLEQGQQVLDAGSQSAAERRWVTVAQD